MSLQKIFGAGGSSQQLSGDGYATVLRLARDHGLTDDPVVRQQIVDVYVLERILGLLGQRIRQALVVSSEVELVAWGSLPRSDYKSKLVDWSGAE